MKKILYIECVRVSSFKFSNNLFGQTLILLSIYDSEMTQCHKYSSIQNFEFSPLCRIQFGNS